MFCFLLLLPIQRTVRTSTVGRTDQHGSGGGRFVNINMKEYTLAAKRFYRSTMWHRTRALYAESVGGLCERCRASGLYTPGKIVHHKIHLDDAKLRDPQIALSFDNLELLCQDCHNKEHHKTNPSRRYSFDAAGNIIKQE